MLQDRLGVPERRACRYAGQHRSTQHQVPLIAGDDAALRAALRHVSRDRPRCWYRRAHQLLLDEAWQLNRERTQRLWREEGLRAPRWPSAPARGRRPAWCRAPWTKRSNVATVLSASMRRWCPHTIRSLGVQQRRRKRQRLGTSTIPPQRRAAGLVPVLRDRQRIHRARVAVAEPLRRELRHRACAANCFRPSCSPSWPKHACSSRTGARTTTSTGRTPRWG